MKKLIYTAAVVLTLGVFSSCTKENDVTPNTPAKIQGEDARDKSDVGTADLKISGEDQRDKSDVGTADGADDSRDKSDVGTADANNGGNTSNGGN